MSAKNQLTAPTETTSAVLCLYYDIRDQASAMAGVDLVSVWNNQTSDNQKKIIAPLSVYFELSSLQNMTTRIQGEDTKQPDQLHDVEFVLHVVMINFGRDDKSFVDLLTIVNKIYRRVYQLRGNLYSRIIHIGSIQDVNHNQTADYQILFKTVVTEPGENLITGDDIRDDEQRETVNDIEFDIIVTEREFT